MQSVNFEVGEIFQRTTNVAPFCKQLKWLAIRSIAYSKREPLPVAGRIGVNSFMSLLLILIFALASKPDDTQETINQNLTGAMFLISMT